MSITAGVAVGSALTLVIDATPTPVPSAYSTEAPQALSGSIIVAVDSDSPKLTLSPDDYRHLNFTAMRTDHWQHKNGYDSTTPRNMMLTFAAVLLLCMLVQHARFLTRLFASFPERKRATQSARKYGSRRPSDDLPPVSAINSATYLTDQSQLRTSRRVGGGGLFSGWILRKGQPVVGLSSPDIDSKEGFDHSNSRPSMPSRSFSVDSATYPSPLGPAPPQFIPPPHLKPALNHLPFSRWLHVAPFSRIPAPFGSTLKVPQLYIIAAYLTVCVVALFWKSNPLPPTASKPYGNDYQRSGLIAMVQIPLVVALGVRGNIIGMCVGKGYERLKTFHKIVGRTCFIASSIHSAFWIAKWTWMGKVMDFSRKPLVMWGWIAWASLIMIVVTSLPWVRKKWFNLFEVCHTIGIMLFLGGTAMHVKVAEPWCAAAGFVYLLSLVMTLTKTKIVQAELLALPSSASTVVTIPALRSGWRAGQHVRIRVPALGFALGHEGHPFTISSAPDGEGLILMCKNTGDWTNALFKLAQGSMAGRQAERGLGIATPTDVTMIVEGPHGGLGNTLLPSFSSVLLFAGGSGITHSLSLAHDLLTRAATGVVRARTVDLVWIIRTEDIARPLMPTLLDMVNDAKAFEMNCLSDRMYGGTSPQPTALRVHIYVTRCPSSSPLNLESVCPPTATAERFETIDIQHLTYEHQRSPYGDSGPIDFGSESKLAKDEFDTDQYVTRKPSTASSASGFSPSFLNSPRSSRTVPLSSIAAYPKRADVDAVVSALIEETINRHAMDRTDASGVCVTACGPEAMVESVNVAVRNVDADRRRAVGGLDFEEECFGY